MKLFNQTPLVASFWPSTVFSCCLCCCDAADCKLLWLSMRDSSPRCPTNIFKDLDLESWPLQIAPKWHSVVFTFAVAFSCSENLSFQIIFELSDDFIEFISLGKKFWKLSSVTWLEVVTESNWQTTTKKDQYYNAFEVKITRICNWNIWSLLKSHSYTRGTTKNRAKSVFLI